MLTEWKHFVADAGDERVGRWLDEKIDLARVYAEIAGYGNAADAWDMSKPDPAFFVGELASAAGH